MEELVQDNVGAVNCIQCSSESVCDVCGCLSGVCDCLYVCDCVYMYVNVCGVYECVCVCVTVFVCVCLCVCEHVCLCVCVCICR